ncbi:MAG TPA: ATP-dependent zinc metalloprotease FtsH [Candidatus Dormibacteraeota bacterium]|nr:ATP-dependent zinc metalloprotease FtsH [Candidatus Dormibacteraeota bacterium]
MKATPWGVITSLVILVLTIALVITFMNTGQQQRAQWSYSDLVRHAQAGEVKDVTISSGSATATDKQGATYDVSLPDETATLASDLTSAGVNVHYDANGGLGSALLGLLPNLLFFGLIGLLLWWTFRGLGRGPQNAATSFGRANARMATPERSTVTFTDVAGVDEAKQELTEVVEFLRNPARFRTLGARIPRGMLMVGPPGSGKTLLARAVAGEAGVPFFSISGSEFVEMFVGVGASRVRDLFDRARQASPCIVFVDEIDAVGRQRGAGLGGGNGEREQTLNQLLVEMDGFDTDTHVIVIAATNRPDVLDPALLRPGRFDRRVILDRPDVRGRRAVLDVHTRGKPLAPGVDLDTVARQTPGFCGADLANVVNEAAILAARARRQLVTTADMEEAIARIVAGPERKSVRISDEEKRIVAFHEAGHALVMASLPRCDQVHRISIISRGSALGWTLSLPGDDQHLVDEEALRDQLAGIMGGRAAEALTFQRVTSGAENDIQRATRLARRMVTQWGMSERVGAVAMGENQELVFLGRDLGEQRNYSERMASMIDDEVRRLVEEALGTASRVLAERREALGRLAERLIAEETIDGDELARLLAADALAARPVSVVG